MIFDHNVQSVLSGEFTKLRKSIRCELDLFFILTARGCIDSDRVAAQKPRCGNPFEMILNCLRTFFLVRISQPSLTIAHDQQGLNVVIVALCFKIAKVSAIKRLVFKKRVYVFDRSNAELLASNAREIHVRHRFVFSNRAV